MATRACHKNETVLNFLGTGMISWVCKKRYKSYPSKNERKKLPNPKFSVDIYMCTRLNKPLLKKLKLLSLALLSSSCVNDIIVNIVIAKIIIVNIVFCDYHQC